MSTHNIYFHGEIRKVYVDIHWSYANRIHVYQTEKKKSSKQAENGYHNNPKYQVRCANSADTASDLDLLCLPFVQQYFTHINR